MIEATKDFIEWLREWANELEKLGLKEEAEQKRKVTAMFEEIKSQRTLFEDEEVVQA